MGAEDTWGKLQKITKLVISGALVFGSNRLQREKSPSKVSIIIFSVTYI